MRPCKLPFAFVHTSVTLPLAIPHIFPGMGEHCTKANLTSLILLDVHGHANRAHELRSVNVLILVLAFKMSNNQGTFDCCMDNLPFIGEVMNLAGADPTRAHISYLDGLGRAQRRSPSPCHHCQCQHANETTHDSHMVSSTLIDSE